MTELKQYELNKIYLGDTLKVLRTFPDECVDTIITSPPYYGLRDYGVEGQIGLEPTLEEYINKLLAITAELKRVLKKSGCLFWNHGDCYGGSGTGQKPEHRGKETSGQFAAMTTDAITKMKNESTLSAKCLALQNYRLILKMIDEQNWILRNSIIWNKPNAMPSSVRDRFSNKYEPVFMLVKNKRYYFDLDAVRQPLAPSSIERREYPVNKFGGDTNNPLGKLGKGAKGGSEQIKLKSLKTKIPQDQAENFGSPRARDHRNIDPRGDDKGGPGSLRVFFENNPSFTHPAGKNPGDIWTIPTHSFSEAHFATFPEKLIIPMIKSSCPKDICKKCGKARERIIKRDRPETYNPSSQDPRNVGRGKKVSRHRPLKEIFRDAGTSKTIGWTKCDCSPQEYEPGICLDPFFGAGTVGVVAKKLGRNYIGIELNEEYIKMAERRISKTIYQPEFDL